MKGVLSLARLTVASDGAHFLRDGKPFFWVGDTVWSAFTNAAPEEWKEYLDFRKAQGFNALQINTLPQWDRIRPDLGLYPYPLRRDGSLDYSADPNPRFLEKARLFCLMAAERGFTPVLVVDWADIVPDTWLSAIFPTHIWPVDAVEEHARRVACFFREFDPVYFVSGDTDFRGPLAEEYYLRTIRVLRAADPHALLSMHLCGGFSDLSQTLADSLDFLVYQSGHVEGSEKTLESLPSTFLRNFPGKPLLNAEPCYEGMPHIPDGGNTPTGKIYGEADVLDACRRSILAGAKAGITYGANGLWSWRRPGGKSSGLAASLYSEPDLWYDAMRYPGAEHISGLKALAYPED